MAPGTARKAASRNALSPQPSNFEGTLSHHDEPPGPPGITLMSFKRNDSRTAFFSHWLTFQSPLAPRSATRASPRSSRSSAESTASRTAPLVDGPMLSRCSKASSMVLASSACGMAHPWSAGGLSGQANGESSRLPHSLRLRLYQFAQARVDAVMRLVLHPMSGARNDVE